MAPPCVPKTNHFLAVLLCVLFVAGVERTNFKTCSDSGFCKRNRAIQDGSSPYVAVLDSLSIEDGEVHLQLLNTQTGVRLQAVLTTYTNNVARLHVTELNPIRSRYEVPAGDVVLPLLDKSRAKIENKDDLGVTVTSGDVTVAVQSKPFAVEFAINNQPLVSLNSRRRMNFEHYRQKAAVTTEEPKEASVMEDGGAGNDQQADGAVEAPTAENTAAAVPAPAEEPQEEPGMWEETFKTHTDSKPNGPSSVGLDIAFVGFEHVYGIPEHADSFALKSTRDTDPYRLYNLDVFEYELNNPMALYGSVPVMFAHNDQNTVGVFWQNPSEAWIDVASSTADKNAFSRLASLFVNKETPKVDTHWFFESGVIDLFIMLGPRPADVTSQYAVITGTTPLPPLFSLAYHQSRWNYNDEADVQSVHEHFDKHDIPLDVIWLDIEHTDGKRYFTWDKSKFPNPLEMTHNLTSRSRQLITIVDPHIKRDENYKIYKEVRDLDLFIKDKNGNEFDGWCWPGSSSYPDFTLPQMRNYWSSKFALSEYGGTTLNVFTWNDMNEPSVFNGPEITMHKDAKHGGGVEHREVHNIYGLYVHMASAQGLIDRSGGVQRPFVLSRAFFAGTQRWGAVWTGDNTGDWGHLKISTPMLLSLSLVGITFCGADVGGFFRNSDAELLTRWYQAAAYQPFFRAHAHMDTRRREPWLLPELNMRIIRSAIRDRYSLLPYWYTQFYHGEKLGGPVMRPLWFEFPSEKALYTEQEQYMIGPSLLVKPVVEQGTKGVSVYFPQRGSVWYDVDTYYKYEGGTSSYIPTPLDKIPVFQRGGHIIPRWKRVRRASNLAKEDPFTLIVALSKEKTAEGDLYIDDYSTFEYRLGKFAHLKFIFNGAVLQSRAEVGPGFVTAAWLEQIVVAGIEARPAEVLIEAPGATRKLECTYDAQSKVLVIRKPGVNIIQPWTIKL